jgi:hypothetical protein
MRLPQGVDSIGKLCEAMPVILRTAEQVDTWLTAPPDDALRMQARWPTGR